VRVIETKPTYVIKGCISLDFRTLTLSLFVKRYGRFGDREFAKYTFFSAVNP
jgi:hypothetical protein